MPGTAAILERSARELTVDWNDLRYYLAVARTQRLTESARQLGVSQATVARRISALETSLKTTLFTKGPEGYLLTEAGESLLSGAEQSEAQLLLLERGAATPTKRLAGTVRIAVPELLGQHLIVPALSEFLSRYPAITVEVMADVRPVRLAKREADILIRLAQPTHGDYSMRRIGSIALGLFGSKAYVAAHGNPLTVGDLNEGHRFIGWDASLGFLPMARWLSDVAPEANVVLRAHTMGPQLAAVEAGIGLAMLPGSIATRLGLVRVLTAEAPLQSDIWLLQLLATHDLARVRALADHIATTIEKSAKELAMLPELEARRQRRATRGKSEK